MKGALKRDKLIKQADKLIARVIENNPYLTPWGFVSKKDLEKTSPQDLLRPEYVKAFNECYTWLSCITCAKNINTYRSSYGLKHVLENLIGMYVPNGAFIAAALALQMPCKPDGINCYFPISKTDIKNAEKGYDIRYKDLFDNLDERVFIRYKHVGYERSKTTSSKYIRTCQKLWRPSIELIIDRSGSCFEQQIEFSILYLYKFIKPSGHISAVLSANSIDYFTKLAEECGCKLSYNNSIRGNDEPELIKFSFTNNIESALKLASTLANTNNNVWELCLTQKGNTNIFPANRISEFVNV